MMLGSNVAFGAFFAVISLCQAYASWVSSASTQSTQELFRTYSNSFVKRSGNTLTLNGHAIRMAGPNVFWMGLDVHNGQSFYPTKFTIDDVLTTAQMMGATVVRSHTLGISVGHPLSFHPDKQSWRKTALDHMDYAVQRAQDLGIRLIIPLVDNWSMYYSGGYHNFSQWDGKPDEAFFTDETVIGDFKFYISALLNHQRFGNGIRYKNDPTILAWETGNEIHPPSSWTNKICLHIKQTLDSKHLVFSGMTQLTPDILGVSCIDGFSHHFYPLSVPLLQKQVAQVTSSPYYRVYYVGEYDWPNCTLNELQQWLAMIEKLPVALDMYWSLLSHGDKNSFNWHSDGLSLYYPGPDSNTKSRVQYLRTHAFRMAKGNVPPFSGVGPPSITQMDKNGKRVVWRGTAGAVKYHLQRTDKSPDWNPQWWDLASDLSDFIGYFDDPQRNPTITVWYRIRGANWNGYWGSWSSVFKSEVQT